MNLCTHSEIDIFQINIYNTVKYNMWLLSCKFR